MRTKSPACQRRAAGIRGILFILGAPLIVCTFLAVRQFEPPIMGVRFTADGRELLTWTARYVSTADGSAHPVTDFRVWDVATGQLLRNIRLNRKHIDVTPDGRCLVAWTGAGDVEAFDVQSFKSIFRTDLIVDFARPNTWDFASDRLLTLKETGDDTAVIACHHIPTRRRASIAIQTESLTSGHAMATPGLDRVSIALSSRFIFLSERSETVPDWKTRVFEFRGETLSERPELYLAGLVQNVSDNGRRVVVDRGGILVIHDIDNNQSRPLPTGTTGEVYLSADAQLVAVHDAEFVWSVLDGDTGNRLFTTTGEPAKNVSHVFRMGSINPLENGIALSWNQQHMAIIDAVGTVAIVDIGTGQVLHLIPRPNLIAIWLGVAVVLWSVLWIAAGTWMRRGWPLLDVLLIHSIVFAVLSAHSMPRERWEIDPRLVSVWIALIAELMGILLLWWFHSSIRWSLRLTAVIAGGAAVAGLMLLRRHADDSGVWNSLLGAVGFMGLLSVLYRWQLWRRVTIVRGSDSEQEAPAVMNWQVPIRDVLLLTAAIALLLAVARHIEMGSRTLNVLAYVTVMGMTLAATTFTAAWATLSPRQLWLRVIPFVVVPAIAAPVAYWIFGKGAADSISWCYTLHITVALAVVFSLSIFRLHGFRFGRCSPT